MKRSVRHARRFLKRTGARPHWVAAALAGVALFGLLVSPSCRSTRSPATTPTATVEKLTRLPSESPEVRIRVARFTDRIEVGGPSDVAIGRPADPAPRRLATPVEIRRSRSAWLASSKDGPLRRFAGAESLRIRSADGATLTLDGAEYPGDFDLVAASPESIRFDVIERTDLESYLPGVLAKELYAGWSDATFEAQAIAARSYAMHERQRRRNLGRHFDLESTTRDQAYGGAALASKPVRAARNTAGIVLLDDEGQLLRSYYSSTCGGRPASAADTWPTTLGYEFNRARPIQASPRESTCQFSPVYRWTTERTADEIVARIRAFGEAHQLAVRKIKSISRIAPQRKNPVGRPVSYHLYDKEGRWWALSSNQLRRALNFDAEGFQATTSESRVRSGDLEFRMSGDKVVISGRGFGHGVGLCQFGAEGRARRGDSPEQMLRSFYPGASLHRLY